MFPRHTAPSEDVWVAFDLETTGLDADRDAIIEIGETIPQLPRLMSLAPTTARIRYGTI